MHSYHEGPSLALLGNPMERFNIIPDKSKDMDKILRSGLAYIILFSLDNALHVG